MNIPVLIFVGILFLIMIIILIIRNKKDRKELENTLNNDFPHAKEEEGDGGVDVDADKV